jgi:hypothetical protein
LALDKDIELPPGVYTVQFGFVVDEKSIVIDLITHARVKACGYTFARIPEAVDGIEEEK